MRIPEGLGDGIDIEFIEQRLVGLFVGAGRQGRHVEVKCIALGEAWCKWCALL